MKNSEGLLQNIRTCLVFVIILVALNTILTICVLFKGTTSKANDTTSTDSNYDVSMFAKSTPREVLTYFNNGDTKVVYMGRSTCQVCVSFLPVLRQVQDDYGYKTVYLDIEEFATTSDDFKQFIAKLDMTYTLTGTSEGDQTGAFGSFYKYTPAVFIIKDGKMVDGEIGALSYEAFAEMLEENGFKK